MSTLSFALLAAWLAYPSYKRHKEARSTRIALTSLASNDLNAASVAARQALRLNPNNADACRVMAAIASRSNPAEALEWRRRVAILVPAATNFLDLAVLALAVEHAPHPTAQQAVAAMASLGTNWAPYHELAAELSARSGQFTGASSHLAEALRLNPTNTSYELKLAVLGLQSTNRQVVIEAREKLQQMAVKNQSRNSALRWLATSELNEKNFVQAVAYSEQLLNSTEVSPQDRFRHLAILETSHSDAAPAFLTELKTLSSTNLQCAHLLIAYLISNKRTEEALAWLGGLPEETRLQQPIPMAFSDCFVSLARWEELENYLADQKWTDGRDFMRSALLARAAWHQGSLSAATTRWRTAVREAALRLPALKTLVQMSIGWGEFSQKEEVLLRIVERFPRESWAIDELARSYIATGNTRGLNKVYAGLTGSGSTNLLVMNNMAATSMLLRTNLALAYRVATNLYSRLPTDPTIVSTFALALHRQGKSEAALELFEKLPEESLITPSIALYYGITLAAVGQREKASNYLARASSGLLLPEEKALLETAL